MKSQREAFHPSPESLRTIEASAQNLRPDNPSHADWHRSYIANHKSRIALDLDIVRERVPPRSSVLELGSIPLLLTVALSKCNYDVTGCDLNPDRYSSSIRANQINVTRCDIETEALPFAGNVFDAVVFNELFEHLRINPVFTLSEVLRVMKPGGTLMLSSPNLKSLGGLKNFLFNNRAFSCSGNIYAEYEKLKSLGHMGHVREYTTTEVCEFLENVGFAVTGIIYRGRYSSYSRQIIIRSIPSLSPFATYVATKTPERAPSRLSNTSNGVRRESHSLEEPALSRQGVTAVHGDHRTS